MDRNHPEVQSLLKRRLSNSSIGALSDQSPTIKKTAYWGVKNFLPSRDAEDDDASIALCITYLQKQGRLKEAKQDAEGIKSRMQKTLADRRRLIVEGATVNTVMETYPILFSEKEVCC